MTASQHVFTGELRAAAGVCSPPHITAAVFSQSANPSPVGRNTPSPPNKHAEFVIPNLSSIPSPIFHQPLFCVCLEARLKTQIVQISNEWIHMTRRFPSPCDLSAGVPLQKQAQNSGKYGFHGSKIAACLS